MPSAGQLLRGSAPIVTSCTDAAAVDLQVAAKAAKVQALHSKFNALIEQTNTATDRAFLDLKAS